MAVIIKIYEERIVNDVPQTAQKLLKSDLYSATGY
jgi:hypothetical protein